MRAFVAYPPYAILDRDASELNVWLEFLATGTLI